MQTIKRNAKGDAVKQLQMLLAQCGCNIIADGQFGPGTEAAVKQFQANNHLEADGIVGNQTWQRLEQQAAAAVRAASGEASTQSAEATAVERLTAADITRAAEALNVRPAAIRAVLEVETGNRGGFLQPGYPTILFEGHIFWSQLIKRGISPAKYAAGNEDILYAKWTKAHYKSGMAEYERLKRAQAIHIQAANASASWGLPQIMGFNYEACGCQSIDEFVARMKQSEGAQLDLFVQLIKSKGWHIHLQQLNWAAFARHYNGPEYAKNSYDKKLAQAYAKHNA